MELTAEQLEAKAQRALERVRKSAKERDIECVLTTADIKKAWELWPNCVYSGQPFDQENYKTWERVDNNLGYQPGNVILVGKQLNACKSDHDLERLQELHDTAMDGWEQHHENTLQSITRRLEKIMQASDGEPITLDNHDNWLSITIDNIKRTRSDLEELEKSARNLKAKLWKKKRLSLILDALESGRAKAEAEKLLPPPVQYEPKWWEKALDKIHEGISMLVALRPYYR